MKNLSTYFKMLAAPVKYIDLNGSAIGYPAPLRIALRPSFLAVATVGSAVAVAYPEYSVAIATTAVGSFILSSVTRKILFSKRLKREFGDKIITTDPTPEEQAASFKYRAMARAHSVSDAEWGAVFLVIQTALNGGTLMGLVSVAPWVTDYLSSSYRFRRVAEGKSAIIDRPPPEKILEHFQSPEKESFGSAAPLPA